MTIIFLLSMAHNVVDDASSIKNELLLSTPLEQLLYEHRQPPSTRLNQLRPTRLEQLYPLRLKQLL